MKTRNPKTAAEWQEAVDGAYFYRLLYDAWLYGLITPEPKEVNVERCDWILDQGRKLNVYPQKLKE